jgi:hypothetical protein
MPETPERRKGRLELFASDAIVAKSDYRLGAEGVLAQTARLNAERLVRDGVVKPCSQAKGRQLVKWRSSPDATLMVFQSTTINGSNTPATRVYQTIVESVCARRALVPSQYAFQTPS